MCIITALHNIVASFLIYRPPVLANTLSRFWRKAKSLSLGDQSRRRTYEVSFGARSPTTLSKQAKARSKTGCTTCRKRKKKCDETKPFCEDLHSSNQTRLTMFRSIMSEEQHSLRRLQATRDLEEWQRKSSRRFVFNNTNDSIS